jgi:hypothetical protein
MTHCFRSFCADSTQAASELGFGQDSAQTSAALGHEPISERHGICNDLLLDTDGGGALDLGLPEEWGWTRKL